LKGRPTTALEDSLESIVRRRVLAHLELTNEIQATFTAAHVTAVDGICALVAQIDQPCPIDSIAVADRIAAQGFMRQLPTTHPISRYMKVDWQR
jgi:hypothetical protein